MSLDIIWRPYERVCQVLGSHRRLIHISRMDDSRRCNVCDNVSTRRYTHADNSMIWLCGRCHEIRNIARLRDDPRIDIGVALRNMAVLRVELPELRRRAVAQFRYILYRGSMHETHISYIHNCLLCHGTPTQRYKRDIGDSGDSGDSGGIYVCAECTSRERSVVDARGLAMLLGTRVIMQLPLHDICSIITRVYTYLVWEV